MVFITVMYSGDSFQLFYSKLGTTSYMVGREDKRTNNRTLCPIQEIIADAVYQGPVRGGFACFPSCIAGKLYYQLEATRDQPI